MQSECPYKPAIRPELGELPRFMQDLPLDPRGYPIPHFVGYNKGERDFRVTRPDAVVDAIRKNLCWVCGKGLFREKVFVIGPMCSINRISSEPPSHRECAVWSAVNCPFLTRPHAKRRQDGMPDWSENGTAGVPIARNPGVTLVWYTRSFTILNVANGMLWKLGAPFHWQWFCEGRAATRREVQESIDKGFPILEEASRKDGPEGLQELGRNVLASLRYLPGAS